ncbi:MAG: sensor histidine kinase [Oscillospiraceae bacterium]|nr:sensor histidine kinase [Oscillospiraceae bacterium]
MDCILEQLKLIYENSEFSAIVYDRNFSMCWQNHYAREAFASYADTKNGVLSSLALTEIQRRLQVNGIIHCRMSPFPACGGGVTFARCGEYYLALFCKDIFYSAKQRGMITDGAMGLSASVRESINEISLAGAAIQSLFDSDDPEAERLFGKLRRSNYRMLRSVRNVTLLSQYSAGVLELRKERCDVAALTKTLCRSAADVQPSEIKIQTVLPDHPVETMIDTELFTRALLNLLLNALIYTRDGNRIEVTVADSDAFVTVKVRDRGAGIRVENLSSVCDAYFSCEPADDGGVRPGIGLGLTVASLFCDTHGGSLIISSEFGVGTTALMSIKKVPCAGEAFRASVSRIITDHFSPLYIELGGIVDFDL